MMEGGVWQTVSHIINTTPIFPGLWTASCILLCGAARLTLGDKVQELSRTSPLSVYLMSLLYCYPGAILSALVQAQPPLLLLTRPTQLASFSLVWYLTFYSPLHRVTSSPSLALLLSLAQDWMRLHLVLNAVNSALAQFPDAWLYAVILASLSSSGFVVVKYVEHILLTGLKKPFTIPHHSTKTMFLGACFLVAQHQGVLAVNRSDLFTGLVLSAFILRISTTYFLAMKTFDPYEMTENRVCGLIFGVHKDTTKKGGKKKDQ